MGTLDCESRDCLAFCEPGGHYFCEDVDDGKCPGNCGEAVS